MTTRRIALVGSGLAGRRESLSTLVLRFAEGEQDRSPVFGNEDRVVSPDGTPIVAFVASKRSLYGDPLNPQVVEEFERVATSRGYLFVVDSQQERLEAGREQLDLLRADLMRRGIDLDAIPVVFQLNKRDLANVASTPELEAMFSTSRCRYVESVATRGTGVVEAFETLLLMMKETA